MTKSIRRKIVCSAVTSRKSQAAIEFIMTYGWAILAATLALAALGYFGIANPQQSLPEKCQFSSFVCIDAAMYRPNRTQIILSNSLGQIAYNPTAMVTNTNVSCTTNSAGTWMPDTFLEVNCSIPQGAFQPRTKVKAYVTINYQKIQGGYPQVSLGEIYAAVN